MTHREVPPNFGNCSICGDYITDTRFVENTPSGGVVHRGCAKRIACQYTKSCAEELKCSPEMSELIDAMRAEIEYLKYKVSKFGSTNYTELPY